MLAELLALNTFHLMLVFARVGAAVMLLPGIGEMAIPARVRLGFALALSLIVMPVVAGGLPAPPAQPMVLMLLLGGEILLGIAVGTMARLLISTVQVTGTIVAYHVGMATANMFDPTAGQQGAMIGAFLATVAVTLLFVTGMHHMLIAGIVDSYTAMPPGAELPIGDLAETATRIVSLSFRLGLELAMPAVIVAMLLLMGMGLMARLLPQVQIFFVALPAQVMAGLFIMALTLSTSMLVFLDRFQGTLGEIWTR
ncbi:MAG: flagellar biosynthetic protein FliR [Alphaproteobacteria bacterium]|nr:flagellar biosynthetic protein FliR [Alphaproteobacteria bacterium]